ncbi:MAG TPA: helix-turn-helix transcriptional regulator [Bradyrhizobium sp.]|uniref:helix-turn-helix domain-containing protein n=1 Tax=Bradyrhizobium sp. TaxID=376 RepID=UPI002D7E6E5A|nr:helix-turn-helix transcriptional regulator [Bradyrhizobium sp.]HET7889763.1 helix-turn-helix transcriptional regulator [Bradyrhizobium sp.]
MTSFHFDIGGRARNAGRFIGRVRGELLRALAERKSDGGLSQEALARKLDTERSLINRQLAGESNLTLRSLADLAWAMDLEISFELKKPAPEAGQNQPVQNQPLQAQTMTTSTVRHGAIKYINGAAKQVSGPAPANSGLGQPKKSA